MKRRIQAADSIRFYVRGRGAQRLLGQAAQAGLKLERIAPQADGFTAVMSGAGWAKLCQLAGAGGWQVIQMQRRGPGPLAERLLRRPGILAGIGLFFVLLHWLGGFLWCMDLELLTVPQQESIRTLLAQSGIWEGCRPSQAELAQAQQLLEASSDFGWVSLNFTGGCLTAEGTPLQQAHAEPPAQNTGLYARAGGEVLAVNIASGFAQVQPGQYVGNGMLLAAAEKLDWTLLPEETQVWAEDQILYTLKTNSQMDVALSCAVVEGKRTLTENCTAAGLPAEPVFTWEDWKKAISLAETLYGGFSEGELYQTLSALAIPEPEDPATGAPSTTGQGAISWEAELPAAYARVWYTVGAGTTESSFASTDVQDWRMTFSISLYASKDAYESERT